VNSDDARVKLREYLQPPPSQVELSDDSVMKRVARQVVPGSARPFIAAALTDLVRPRERRKAARLSQRDPLLLHLGSASLRKPGWVNVDLIGHRGELAWNLSRPLPFASDSADGIFHEHLIEHLTLKDGLGLNEECYRVLKPGGVLRIGVPDALAYARAYACGEPEFIERYRPGRPTPLLALLEAFYSWGHKTMYDFELLLLLCRAAGFEQIEQRRFGESRIQPSQDSEHRRLESIYVEAIK
jgi:predicted SAM-dependent methyltransferase